VMLSFASKQGWKKLGVIYTDDPLGQQCKWYIYFFFFQLVNFFQFH
jgi:hypothetical protein